MRTLSGRIHWLTMGLALLVSAQGLITNQVHGQVLGGGGILNGGAIISGGGEGSLLSGQLLERLPLAPFNEGNAASQRWFDVYAGTIGLRRTHGFGNFQAANGAGLPVSTNLFTKVGSPTGAQTDMLFSNQLDLDRMRYGLEIIANLQTGVGSNLEVRYFGLNNWTASASATSSNFPNPLPDLYSVFSRYGTNPPPTIGPPPTGGGFDDTDRSFIHSINYNSELHNGEINFRKRWVCPISFIQGSVLGGIRYFDLDEAFQFQAIGSNNNTFAANQLRFFDYNVATRNELTGVQMGGDIWATIVPGVQLGVEGKTGIFGNHAEVESIAASNSIAGAREFLQDGKTAYIGELVCSMVYRMTYSWSVKTSYNLVYVDNVAVAMENVNTRDFSNALGGGAFTGARFPFIDTDGEIFYQGWSIGGEFMW